MYGRCSVRKKRSLMSFFKAQYIDRFDFDIIGEIRNKRGESVVRKYIKGDM